VRFHREEGTIEGDRRIYIYRFDEPLEAKQKLFWGAVAETWRTHAEWVEEWLAPVTAKHREVLEGKGGLLVDLGCGAQTMPIPEGWTVIGCDIVPKMLAPHRRVVLGTMVRLPFRSQVFDSALSRMALMLVPDPLTSLKEIYRVLKPGGFLTFSVWGKSEGNVTEVAFEVLARRLGIRSPGPRDPHAFRLSDPKEVEELLLSAGFISPQQDTVEVTFYQKRSPKECVPILFQLAGPLRTLLERIPPSDQQEVLLNVERRLAEVDRLAIAHIWHARKGS
jgi:ubiquinone/menaquinone biosynthesis C-methylase UbiE